MVAGYILSAIGLGALPPGPALALLFYIVGFFIVSIALLAAIKRRPGIRHWRRAVAMVDDYLGITAVLTLGGEVLLPVYAALLWVTVRLAAYGPRYLRVATVCAVLTIATTTLLSGFWHAQPFMVATFVLTALLVPAYAQVLLTRTRLAHDAALAANRAKSRFLGQASHDLRQPVHAIGLFTDCLRSAPLGPDEQQMVDRIERSLQSISRLFRSLFDVSTLDSGRVAPKREVVALGEVLGEVVGRNSEAARWAGVELRLVPTRLRVLADAGLLATIVQNLVSNALKYAAGGPVLVGCDGAAAGWRSRSMIAVAASQPSICPTSSTSSTACRSPASTSTVWGSGSLSCSAWPG